MSTNWTRNDLPSDLDVRDIYYAVDYGAEWGAILDAVVSHLDAHHPKPPRGGQDAQIAQLVRMCSEADLKRTRAERERDAAVERAEQAEARIEGWREAHDALMENPCPVTLDEVEKAIDTGVRGTTDGDLIDPDADLPAGECARLAINAVWALVSGDDPAVYVVRESDLPEVERDEDGNWIRGDVLVYGRSAELEMVRQHVASALETVADCEAVARAIEQEADQ